MANFAGSSQATRSAGHCGARDKALVIVSIVGYRNADDVSACLRALARSEHREFIVSVCENGGGRAFDALISNLQGIAEPSSEALQPDDDRIERTWSGVLLPHGQPIHVLQAKSNFGFASGVNLTIRQFVKEPNWSAVWLLNPDAEPEPDALAALVARSGETGAAIVGSRLIFRATDRVQLYGGRWRPLIARGFNIGLNAPKDAAVDVSEIEQSMTYVSGASLYATRAFVNEAGLMDEDYFLYGEEVDWCMRIDNRRLAYAHASVVYHRHGAAIGSNRNRQERSMLSVYLDERNKLRISRRYFPRLYPIILVTTFVLLSQYVYLGAYRNAMIALRGWMAGVRGEIGPPKFMSLTRDDAIDEAHRI